MLPEIALLCQLRRLWHQRDRIRLPCRLHVASLRLTGAAENTRWCFGGFWSGSSLDFGSHTFHGHQLAATAHIRHRASAAGPAASRLQYQVFTLDRLLMHALETRVPVDLSSASTPPCTRFYDGLQLLPLLNRSTLRDRSHSPPIRWPCSSETHDHAHGHFSGQTSLTGPEIHTSVAREKAPESLSHVYSNAIRSDNVWSYFWWLYEHLFVKRLSPSRHG
jgi:hypothetical protein